MFIWRVLRRLLAQIIRLLLLNRVVTLGLIGVLIVAFVIMPLLSGAGSLTGNISPAGTLASSQPVQAAPATNASSTPTVAVTQTMPQSPQVQTYIKAMMAFDATGMWNTLYPGYQSQLTTNGVTLATLTTQEAQDAKSGIKYDLIYYIGGFTGPSGLTYYFYVITFTGPDSSGKTVNLEYAYSFSVVPNNGGIYGITRQ